MLAPMSNENEAWRIIHIPGKPAVQPDQQCTVNVFASLVEPKLVNTIIRRLSQIAPLENLHHVKRVKKNCLEGGKPELSVILCLAPENGGFDEIPHDVQEVINTYQLTTFLAKVCKYAASSKEEWQEQCKLWPTSYHPPTYNISGISGFSEEESQLVFSFMKYAVELAKSGGNVVVNAVAIVDPSSNQIVASARDEVCPSHNSTVELNTNGSSYMPKKPVNGATNQGLSLKHSSSNGLEQQYKSVSCLYPWNWADQTHLSSPFWHPLRHAAIVAIESSAARDRLLFPDVKCIDKATEVDCILSPTFSRTKRQKTDMDNVDNDEHAAHGRNDLPLRPYLCTGYDIYLVWEPCAMCAMALVHQRIRRVFFAFRNPSAGAVCSLHRLQGEKSLNHHYAVFRVVMPPIILDTAKTSSLT